MIANCIFANVWPMPEATSDKEFLANLVDWTGKSASDVARTAGLTPSTLTRPLNQEVSFQLSKATMDKLQRAYPEFPGFGGDDDSDEVEIQEWDIAYGMGGGTYLDLPVTGTKHKFSRTWLKHFTHSPPEKIFFGRGSGDSMSPTILDADIVIIDTSEREIRVGDKIWAVVYGTTGYIKRIRPMPDGGIKMLSDNPAVPPETAYDGEISVVGRVVAVVRKT